MKKLLFIISSFTTLAISAQTVIFNEEINITDYEPIEFVMPPSPLTTQVLFVGGHDIVQTTPTYGNPAGRAVAKEWHDFIGFTPDDSGNSLGWVSVNHEMIYHNDRIGDGGGMTSFRVSKINDNELVVMEQSLSDGRKGQFFNVDFVNTVGETGMNCAGISAPNGRIWTAEEWFRESTESISTASNSTSNLPIRVAGVTDCLGVRDTADFKINAPQWPLIDTMTIKKYQNFNYMVEVDPKEAVAIQKQYNWGRAGWEGGAISADGKYVYLGIDGSPAPWVRAVAETPWDFNTVSIQVYKQDNEPSQRWIEIDMNNVNNILGGLTRAAWNAGATMFMRNEWVAIDQSTGMVYWTETGRDGTSGAGARFLNVSNEFPTLPAQHHQQLATDWFGIPSAIDSSYQDYYGRVLYYDPTSEEVGVVVNGGPFFDASPTHSEYPDKHLSNPDGLNILTINGKTFLMIQEDLNGTSFGRTPDGVNNPLCEMYLISANAKNAPIDELVRITAIPKGAEITGAIQIDDNTILVNSQHPNAQNPFPFNHSLTMAIHGWADVTTSLFEMPNEEELSALKVFPNPATRQVFISESTDFAIYNNLGHRVKVLRNTNQADVSDLPSGVYYIQTSKKETYKLIIE